MKIFLDTNILLEYFCNRTQADTVEKILRFIKDDNSIGFVSAGSLYTLAYILETQLKRDELHNPERLVVLRSILRGVLTEYVVLGNADFLSAVDDEHFADLEDSFQYRSALSAGCDVLLTLNYHDFRNAVQEDITVLTPQQFASLYMD